MEPILDFFFDGYALTAVFVAVVAAVIWSLWRSGYNRE